MKKEIIVLLFSYLGIILGFFNTVYKAKVFSTEELGLVTIFFSIILILSHCANAGVPHILLKFSSSFKERKNKNGFLVFFAIVSILTNLIVITIFYLARKIVYSYYQNPLVEENFYYILLLTFTTSTLMIYDTMCRVTHKEVVGDFFSNFLIKLLHFFLLVFLFFYHTSVSIYFLIYFIFMLLCIVSLIIILLKKGDLSNPNLKDIRKNNVIKYFKYGFFLFVGFFAGTLVFQIDRLMIGSMIGLEEAGIYGISVQLCMLLSIIPQAFSKVQMPQISLFLNEGNLPKLKQLYTNNLEAQLYIGLFIYTVFIFFVDKVLLLIGKDFTNGKITFYLVFTGVLFNLLSGMSGEIAALSEYYKFDFYSKVILAIQIIALNYILIPYFGVEGAALGTLINYIIYSLIKISFIYKKFGILPYKLSNLLYINAITPIVVILAMLNYMIDLSIYTIPFIGFLLFIFYDLILLYFGKKDMVFTLKFYELFKKRFYT
ncbi:MAG: hypothetical protein CSA15_12355 [Candidatus Delongbacteria bacterium]|nr:MAG: hypothetical protein CSA15_12355 [Candidatus Delongbacteria bacterium]